MNRPMERTRGPSTKWAVLLALVGLMLTVMPARGAGLVTLAFREVSLAEVFELLSRKERVNVLLGEGVEGTVSVNLYQVRVEQAIESIAEAAGFVVERRAGTYFILKKEDVGKDTLSPDIQVRTLKVQYTDPETVAKILESHTSRYGKVSAIPERNVLVLEDQRSYLDRLEAMVADIDREPRQILIEAKILEISLLESEQFGIDWTRLFRFDGGEGSFGSRFGTSTAAGLFFTLATPNVEASLNLLRERGRVRTLSTPKLLALEDQEASVVIGNLQGYKVTTTVNEVTSESVEFLESGVILRVTPSVDRQGRILMEIHPEVSTGSFSDDGIPSKSTTEVTTRLLAADGQPVFIGGLISNSTSRDRDAVPGLGDAPVVGWLFSSNRETVENRETVVLITPYIVRDEDRRLDRMAAGRHDALRAGMEVMGEEIEAGIEALDFRPPVSRDPGRPDAAALPAAPLDNATVTLVAGDGRVVGSTRTDPGGRYTLEAVPAGDYQLVVSAPGYSAWARPVTIGDTQVTVTDVTLAR